MDWNPERNISSSHVNQYISNISEKIEEQQWPYHLSNDLNNGFTSLMFDSQPNNGVPTSTRLPNVIANQTGFHNSQLSGYNVCNTGSIAPQYVGCSAINNVASTNTFNNVISYTRDFDARRVPNGELLNSLIHSSSQNIYRQQSFHQGQYRSSTREKRIANNMSVPICVTDVQSLYSGQGSLQPITQNTQKRLDCETHLQPRVIRSAPTDQRGCLIPLQSNGFKIQRLNTWTPVQARARVAEESPSLDCYGLSNNICDSAAFSMESRKRKHPLNSTRNESCVGSGTLMEMIPMQSNGFKIQRLDSWKPIQSRSRVAEESLSHGCFGLTCNLCGPTCHCKDSRKRKYPYESPSTESGIKNGTLMDVVYGYANSSVGDGVSQELSPAPSQLLMDSRLPPLEQYSDKSEEDMSMVKTKLSNVDSGSEVNNIITEDAIGNNLISKASQKNSDSTDNEFKKAPRSSVEEISSDRKGESSQVSSEVIICTTFEDLLSSRTVNTSVEANDLVFNEMPNLEQWSNSSEDVSAMNTLSIDSSLKGNNLLKGPVENNDITPEELEEPPKLSFEEKPIDENVESSQVSAEVICGFNTTVDDYESVLESMQSMTPTSEVESDKTESENKSFDDKSENIKFPSASLADSFTASQIKEHLSSFIQPNKEITPSVRQNVCQLCSMDKLSLAPPPMYCSSCDSRIRQKVAYYRLKDEKSDPQYSICKRCFEGSRVCIKLTHGGPVSKTNLKSAKNNEEREDSWVQCDTCQLWQHRICGLYNDETDAEGKAEYVCPKCCLKELENGTGISLPKNVLGAKDLPRTNLSDHIEQRLFIRLNQEREETAKFHGVELEKVPEAEGLVVRVVVSDDKELEVRQQFRDIFHGENYPEKMPYRSKLILLFQRSGGVDLCLFGMYVQEYGSDCEGPSKRCVYISYLDSVKYFKPERKTSSTESLRTFVYHEILIGYLEYCKKRGFATCYIYSCPLKKGDDYIFYCHPDTQKTPEKKKLLQWYKSMLRKATNEGIVVSVTDFYNQFFVPTKEGNIKISVSRLPYFDGDSWSEAAIETSKELEEEEKLEKLCSKLPNKRMLMTMEQDKPTKDALVMQRLGAKIHREKENLMVVRLQHMCTYCQEVILSGSRWSCNQCNKIHLCSRCYDDGKLLSQSKMHNCRSGKSRWLSEDVLSEVPLDTNDKDDVLVNNFFKTRDDFLNKCQKSQYHFDKPGHAKYSSMMILYRLTHNYSDSHPWT